MSKLVDSLGVTKFLTQMLHSHDVVEAVRLSDLEEALEKLPVVSGFDGLVWSEVTDPLNDTHTARILCIEKIPEEPLVIEQTFAAEFKNDNVFVPTELKGKRFKVTFQELR